MLPFIIAAALCVYAVQTQDEKESPSLSKQPEPIIPPSPPTEQPIMVKRPLSTDEYQTRFAQPSIFAHSKAYELAELFLRKYLTQDHVEQVAEFDTVAREQGRVQAYRQRFTTQDGNRLWQICAIDTQYGHIYLSLMLDDDGSVPTDTVGVLITYDNPGTDTFIARTTFQQMTRFGQVVFQHDTTVTSEDLLRFFIGDQWYPHSIYQHFMEEE